MTPRALPFDVFGSDAKGGLRSCVVALRDASKLLADDPPHLIQLPGVHPPDRHTALENGFSDLLDVIIGQTEKRHQRLGFFFEPLTGLGSGLPAIGITFFIIIRLQFSKNGFGQHPGTDVVVFPRGAGGWCRGPARASRRMPAGCLMLIRGMDSDVGQRVLSVLEDATS